MGFWKKLFGIGAAAGATVAAAKVADKVKKNNPDGVGDVNGDGKVNAADSLGRTPLMYAAQSTDNPEIVHALLAAGAALQQKDRDRGRGWTPLAYAAARNRNVGVLEALIDAGANVNAPGNDGASPLLLALRGGASKETVTALLDAGANPAATDRESYATGFAVPFHLWSSSFAAARRTSSCGS